MFQKLLQQRFLIHIFLSLLLTGLIQVILLGTFTILFSSRLIENTFSDQSIGRMELLVNKVNITVTAYREAAVRLSRNNLILDALFAAEEPGKEDVSIHLVTAKGDRIYSTHVLPVIYNPNSSEQFISTYLKLKKIGKVFP